MTWTRHENGAGATPTFGRRADQLWTYDRRRRRQQSVGGGGGGAQLYMRYYSRVGPRASTCEKVFFSTFSLSGFFELERNWIWLTNVRRWAVSCVTDYFFIQFYVSAIFHNDWTREMNKMKRKTLYKFNSVQLTFNQCVFNRIQYRTEHSLYSTRLDKVDRMKSSTRSVQLNTAWRMETQHRLYMMKSSSLTLYTFTLSPRFTLLHFSTFHFYTLFTLST